jgi:peptidoglycan/xylan/chitin deacetylase (PgdA/CDA1 family)
VSGPLTRTVLVAGAAAVAVHGAPALLKPLGARGLARRCADGNLLALTYDDGPGTRVTPRVLDVLAQHNAHATFFATGARAAAAPQLLERAARAGHAIGAHGAWHRNALLTAPGRAVSDMLGGLDAVARWNGDGPPLLRPPYGRLSGPAWAAARGRGARLCWWTIDSGDTRDEIPTPGAVVDRVRAAGGGVVLLHDFDREPVEPRREDFLLEVTDALLRDAAGAGRAVVTMDALTR